MDAVHDDADDDAYTQKLKYSEHTSAPMARNDSYMIALIFGKNAKKISVRKDFVRVAH